MLINIKDDYRSLREVFISRLSKLLEVVCHQISAQDSQHLSDTCYLKVNKNQHYSSLISYIFLGNSQILQYCSPPVF